MSPKFNMLLIDVIIYILTPHSPPGQTPRIHSRLHNGSPPHRIWRPLLHQHRPPQIPHQLLPRLDQQPRSLPLTIRNLQPRLPLPPFSNTLAPTSPLICPQASFRETTRPLRQAHPPPPAHTLQHALPICRIHGLRPTQLH